MAQSHGPNGEVVVLRNDPSWAYPTYPHEMCFGRLYILSGADSFPVCLGGAFFDAAGAVVAQ
jgi:hypothetical protein